MTTTLSKLGHHQDKHQPHEAIVIDDLTQAFIDSPLSLAHRLQSFPRHVRRQDIARFLVKYELFKLVLPVHGSVIEGGVFSGGGLMTWSHLSAILEPYNHTRRIVGFDTFTGFSDLRDQDVNAGISEHLQIGAFATHDSIMAEIHTLAAIHDRNRPLGHIEKIELVQGDATVTIPQYVSEHPHLLVSLLYLDFDLYSPTKTALEAFWPLMPKGAIVAFDELNCQEFPGETRAFLEFVGSRSVALRRLPIDPYISYFAKE